MLILTACAAPAKRPEVQAGSDSSDSHAYALLFDLLGDEKDVSKLLIIKRERAELGALIKQISRIAGDAHKKLAAFGKKDPHLNLKDLALPPGEIEARKAIAKTKSKELLTEKGKAFELRILLSQNEALTYGAHLAQVIAATETDHARGEFVQQLSRDLSALQRRVFDMLLAAK